MNIDNEPGRWRCKNQKAPLLGEIKITGGGTAGNWCTFRKERNYCRKLFLVPEKFVLLQRHFKYLLMLREICFQKKLSVWVFEWADVTKRAIYLKVIAQPESIRRASGSIWEHPGASGDIELIEVFSIVCCATPTKTNISNMDPLNAHQPHPQKKNMMGWDIQAYLKLKALVSQELNF